MIQAYGLTSDSRKALPPAVDDVSFEAHAGRVTVLLGAPGTGKTTVLRLLLGLQQGRGLACFRGRPLNRIAHPSREVGVLLGDVPGHPARTVRGHLRMLCAAAGVTVRRADEVLEVVGLVSLRDERLGGLSRGMDRRLGLACALLADPHTLVLDEPADGLSGRESRWLYGMLRAHAEQGGTVLTTTADPKEAARVADRVLTLEQGRLMADQEAADFARTRLRPRVAVRSPHAVRLAAQLTREARAAQRSVEVVQEGGNRLSVYGSSCADVGETAFRHGILVHQLADETGDMGPAAAREAAGGKAESESAEGELAENETSPPAVASLEHLTPLGPTPTGPACTPLDLTCPDLTCPDLTGPASTGLPEDADDPRSDSHSDSDSDSESVPSPPAPRSCAARTTGSLPALPPPLSVRSAPSPLRPLRYEIRRATGISTGFLTGAAVLFVSALTAVLLGGAGHTAQARLLAAWPVQLPLPPAALGAGLLGALAFGDEFRHPALAADRGTVPRRLGVLTAKLLVAAVTAVTLAFLTVGCDAEVLYLVYGQELARVPADWMSLGVSWLGLVVGCAWAGVLAAGVFRSTSAGLAAVVAVPVVVVPLVQKAVESASVRAAAGLPMRLRETLLVQWPFGGERYVDAAARVLGQPVGGAMTLSLAALLCAYLLTTLRGRVR
ncbi:ABC-type multidrug transport system ATPase subunit [Streptomyces achromogenes]|uniref:ABC-type multidrug transport system ATPase subunit n=1 Tax=Streptomyces achromogenes TaxID=67255 RepID=A0ABU0Q7S0_STRAH|nr:ATP-binding cassette domain-containing protein [Streptomyces achromogenes]MDQ0686720.1 ABC-type multidrug transport system ATPase subunit [Streptomyces achromogenes]MDQ0833863.1 ABC-type multidrug transport system ATPase subunit [Streptomyces achromogenes]